MKRANGLMIAGAVLLIAGVALVWVLGRDDEDTTAKERRVAVLVARADLSVGESGDDAVAAGKVSIEEVDASSVTEGALLSTSSMAGTIVSAAVPEGQQVRSTDVRTAVLRTGSIEIPDDKQAIALTVDFTAGGAGYAGPGDRVNVYVNIPPDSPGAPRSPYTKLLLSDVEVLDVSDELAPQRAIPASTGETTATTTPRTPGSTLTILVALDAAQAEQAIFANNQNELYVTLLPKGQEPSETGGVDYTNDYLEGLGE